jgi:hypothetical protein
MLWSGNDDLVGIAIADSDQPRPAPLADNRSGLSMEAPVRHAFLDAGFHDNMYPVTDLKSLDNGGHRR